MDSLIIYLNFHQYVCKHQSGLGQSVIREKKITQNKCSYALRKTTRLNFIGAINVNLQKNKLKWYMIIPVKINDIHVNQPARLVRDLLKTTLHTTQMVCFLLI